MTHGVLNQRGVLDPTGSELHALLDVVTDHLCGLVDQLADRPVADSDDVQRLLSDPELRRSPPEHGRPINELLQVIGRATAKGINPAHGGLLGFVPGGGLTAAAIADLIANVLNRHTGQAASAPGLVALETDLLQWLAGLFALPTGSAGLLTTGASMATLSAMVTARTTLLPDNFLAATLYVSSQTHGHVAKVARILGFPAEAIRVVATDQHLRMIPEALRSAVAADRRSGRRPFLVVASAGTTNTGVVDPLAAIADQARAEGLWLHIDAAYGGFFQLTERGRERLAGIERADSLAVDPHKGLFLPFGTGCLLVRDGRLLRAAHAAETPDYLRDVRSTELPDFCDYGPELTRDFRGLRLWLPLHLHGVAAFRDLLDERLDLANLAFDELSTVPALTTSGRPDLSTFAFRMSSDKATAELLRRVNADGRVHLSSTRVLGRLFIRLCVLNHRTNLAIVRTALELIRHHAAELSRT